jgi:hypothetical protein
MNAIYATCGGPTNVADTFSTVSSGFDVGPLVEWPWDTRVQEWQPVGLWPWWR